jgi:hypothetical protein
VRRHGSKDPHWHEWKFYNYVTANFGCFWLLFGMVVIFFSCDSSSIRDNVCLSVGLSVGQLVATSFKKSRKLIYHSKCIK